MSNDAKIILSAVDQSAAAFRSVQNGLKQLQTQASGVGETLKGLAGAAGTAWAVGLIKRVAEAGDAMATLSQKSGLSVEKMSALKYAADQSQTSVEDLALGLKRMSVAMAQQPEAFAAIGVKVKDANGQMRALDDVLLDVADVFQSMPDGAAKAALAIKLFGKSGDALIPMLDEGRSGIRALTAEAEKLGIVMSSDMARAAKEMADEWKKLGAVFQSTVWPAALPLMTGARLLLESLAESRKGAGALEGDTRVGDRYRQQLMDEELLTDRVRENAGKRMAIHTDSDVRLISLLDRETNQIRQILASQVEAYKEATAEVGKAREERNRIEQDNVTYMARIRGGGAKKADEVTPSDVIALQAAMRESVQARNFTQAIQQGEEAKKLIDDIVQSGTRSAGYMESFASAVVTLQNQAAQAQQEAAQQRVADIQKVFSETLAKAEALTRVKVSFDTAGAQQAMDQLMAILQAQIVGRPLNVPVIPVSADAIKAVGTGTNPTMAPGTLDIGGTLYPPLPTRAGGGPISGPGTGVSDSVLMRASAGEWVMRAAAVRHYGPALMGAINSLRLPRFASGGMVGGGGDTLNLTWPSGRTTRFSGSPGVSAQVRREFALEALRMGRRG